jgi:hypothetical protein
MNFSLPSIAEASAALKGFWRVIKFDPEFMRWFDLRPEGALRSFGLALPLLPIYLALRLIDLPANYTPKDAIAPTLVIYFLSWVTFPFVLVFVGKQIGREAQAIGAIGFYNWFGVFLFLALAPLDLATYIGIAGEAPNLMSFYVWLASYVFLAWAFSRLMGLGLGGAALLAVFDLITTFGLGILWWELVGIVPV